MFKKRKNKNSITPGDLPSRIKKEFSIFIATPAANLFNTISKTGAYPRRWVREYVTPVKKLPVAESEDDLRPISIIADLARDYNALIAEWLKPFLNKRMDPAQLGGEKGSSITHYLVALFNFIFSKTDSAQSSPQAIIAALIDYSKGFSRISHQKVLIRLSDWGVPGWLLTVVASYLTERSMVVRSRGFSPRSTPSPPAGLRRTSWA